MSLDRKLLARAKNRLEEQKNLHAAEYARRLSVAYEKNPRIREIDREMRESMMSVIQLALSHDESPVSAVEDLSEENMYLQAERIQELLDVGLPADYLDDGYMCDKCHDTGYINSEICSCLMDLYKKEQQADLSSLFKLGTESFDQFELDYYDDAPDPATGVSPRQNMEFVYETCVEYARKFGKNSYNLLLQGGTGLGKTFLSACIARVVSENGFSVVYDTAASIFAKYEDDRFARSAEPQERDELRRYTDCDLLIIDDLGTEMSTAFTVSTLYNLINTRLIFGKKTIISTNYSLDELRRRYTPPIMSRLEGEYQCLTFYGSDIRLLKKELQ